MKKLIVKVKSVIAAWKLLRQANKEVIVDGESKPGWKTTEFWGKVVVQIIILVNSMQGADVDPQMAVAAIAGVEAVYALSRSLVKAFSKKK